MIILQWILPAIVGAVIGYVTNAIAIKMLFRPLTEKRLFGVRIPFTPGILPKQRHKLAESVGNMVARDLLSEDVFIRRISSGEVEAAFAQRIALIWEDIAGDGESELRAFLEKGARTAGESELLNVAVEKAYPLLTERAVSFLRRDDVRALMIEHGSVFLRNVLSKLTTFQRLFLTMGNYNTQLQENMPQIIDSLIQQIEGLLAKPDTREKMLAALSGTLTAENVKSAVSAIVAGISDSDDICEQGAYLGAYLAPKILSVSVKIVPPVLKNLDIRKIVVDKIDSLEMEKVEDIVFGIMRSQFKWINIFGGILGGLIGVIQSLLSYVLNL